MKRPLFRLCLAFLTLLVLAPCALALEVGSVAPDFELPDLDGNKVHLSDYRGQVVILKLATTWCPTCRQQGAEIEEASTYLLEQKVAVIEVFLQDSEAMVRKALEEMPSTVPHTVLMDDGQVRKAYNIYLIPRVLVLDSEQRIRRDGSLITAFDLKKTIERIVAKP